MPHEKIEFPNGRGERLAALLERPAGQLNGVALFAHCFTCTKNSVAASHISAALANHGIAVLRFDFTGLGNSDGDFANTNFSSNIDDLLAAAEFLAATLAPPVLLIGHSLGGAAVLAAAAKIESAKAVVTIGAPATASHVQRLFAAARDEILRDDEALVDLGGRQFRIRRQLLDDIGRYADTTHLAALGKALLVFHSPLDAVVSIDEAARIYRAAKHPKSFVSLDNADHLLTQPRDADYVAGVLSAWAARYLPATQTQTSKPAPAVGEVLVEEVNQRFTRQVTTHHHVFIADEPAGVGDDQGPNPYELLLAALGACTSMTLRMYANKKGLALERLRILLTHERVHTDDCGDCESQEAPVDWISRQIEIDGALSDADRARLLEIADRCPVHRTLKNQIIVADRPAEPTKSG